MSDLLERGALPPHAVARWAEKTPSAVAVAEIGGGCLTYAELHAGALAWASALRGLGVGAGGHVATLLPNGFLGHRAFIALGWLRAVEVPINTAYVGEMLRHALSLSDSRWLLTTGELLEQVRPLLADLPELRAIVLLDGEPAAPVEGVELVPAGRFAAAASSVASSVAPSASSSGASSAAPSGASSGEEFDGPDPWDVACLLFTSGTTGPSKAVITPWGLSIQMWSWVPPDTVGPGEGLFCALPLFHNSGRSGFAHALNNGARFVFREKFSAAGFWRDVREADCRTAALVGPMTALLAGVPAREDDADNPLRSIILGPMIPGMAAFEERFGVRVATCYGQTEVGAPLATTWDHGPWHGVGRVREGYPNPEVRLVDALDRPVADGEVGELVVRCAEPWGLNLGYYNQPEESVRAWRNGWFHTGDMFTRDAEGWYTFFDRRKDVLRRRGENISSFEVEREVGEFPGVVECVAVGVPSGVGDDEVLAAVIVGDPARFDPAALIGFLDGRMPGFMIPRYVRVLDDLPRNATTGRVRKEELRALVAEDRGWDRRESMD